MVLPLPVPPGTDPAAVSFVDLSLYPEFFEHLDGAFPPVMEAWRPTRGASHGQRQERTTLPVQRMGRFSASYVPSISEFERLDERFRLPAARWDELPDYGDWGFAVLALLPGSARRTLEPARALVEGASVHMHPAALSFPTRDPARVFFPTVHLHDGDVPSHAQFDHALFWC